MIVLAFYTGDGKMIDRLIRWWTRGPYCHVQLVESAPPDPFAPAGVTMISASPYTGGVGEQHLQLDPRRWDILLVPGEAAAAADFIRGQFGLKYDWIGLICTAVLPFGWESSNRWFCSEIIGASLGIDRPARFSANALYRLLKVSTQSA